MKTLIKKLPVVAFVIAAIAAMAFTTENENEYTQEFGYENGHWYDVTNKILGEDYLCNTAPVVCTRDMASPSGNAIKFGDFDPLELEPIEQ